MFENYYFTCPLDTQFQKELTLIKQIKTIVTELNNRIRTQYSGDRIRIKISAQVTGIMLWHFFKSSYANIALYIHVKDSYNI